jgi:phospholipase A1
MRSSILDLSLSGIGLGSACLCLALAQSAYAEVESAPVVKKNIVVDKGDESNVPIAVVAMRSAERSYLTKDWNLDDLSNWNTPQFSRLQPYRQTYLLAKTTSNPNRAPVTPVSVNNTAPPFEIDAQEVKFQFSFKTDIGNQHNLHFAGIKTFRLWAAYTQQSNWQAFNVRSSSPMRETIFEPEVIATLGTGHASGLKLINVGLVHQSNGLPSPVSRSWNRVYLLGGWEWNDTTSVLLRGWKRIQENSSNDDNPDITDYLGSGDMVIRWEPREQTQSVSMLLRNNLSNSDNRGYTQIDWATPIKFGNGGRWHLQATSGYGESLGDYNHHQNTFGIGISFREW